MQAVEDYERGGGTNIMCHVSHVMCHVSHVMCQVSCGICCVSRVKCHLSLAPTDRGTYPPLANSPIMHGRLIFEDQKKLLKNKNKKQLKSLKQLKHKNVLRYANISNMLFDQKSPVPRKAGFSAMAHTYRHTDTQTTQGHRNL